MNAIENDFYLQLSKDALKLLISKPLDNNRRKKMCQRKCISSILLCNFKRLDIIKRLQRDNKQKLKKNN